MILNKRALYAVCLAVLPQISNADIINFDFTGRLTITPPDFSEIVNQSIAASFSYDTDSGLGSSGLSITMDELFYANPMTFHDVTMDRVDGSYFIDGTMLVNWLNNSGEVKIEWNAIGLFNAIDAGLQVGDTISGTNLIRNGSIIANVNSALPYSDVLPGQTEFISYAPLAATINSVGFGPGTGFENFKAYFDMGNGNSLHVTSIEVSSVPVPAAVWLFGSGLLGLIGVARRKKSVQ
jgi:hypothetical protein